MGRSLLWRKVCVTLLFLLLVVGCIDEARGTPTAPSPTPTPAVPLPSPTPRGSLPSVLTELDLGTSVGNAYGPTALAVDGDTAYVLCRRYETLDSQRSCVAVVDREGGVLQDLWPLGETPTGVVAAGGGRVYVMCEGEAGEHLISMDAADGRKVYDVDLRSSWHVDGMWMDAQRGRLYLSLPDRIQVRDGQQLRVVDDLLYPFKAVDRHIVLTADRDTLLISLSNAIYAYDLPELAMRWYVETSLQPVQALITDQDGETVLAQGPLPEQEGVHRVLFYSLDEGDLSKDLTIEKGKGKLVWGSVSSGRLVFARRTYPPARAPVLHLWGTDLQGEGGNEERWFGSGLLTGVWGRGPYVLDQQGHRLIAVHGVTLETEKSVQLGVELHDLVMDGNRQRLYVNDRGGTVYEVDVANLQEGTLRLERSLRTGGGEMVLDARNALLLVAQGDGSRVTVVDVKDFAVAHVITGGDRIALDTRRARAIVGSRGDMYQPGAGAVQVWNLMRGERVGVIAEGGIPAYNALRDEIYIAAYGAHVYNADGLERTDSLTPDIDAQSCRGCTGRQFVRDVEVQADLGVLALRMGTTTGGKGAGTLPLPRFFSLDGLAPVSHTVSVMADVNGEGALLPPTGGRVYENLRYVRDASHANLVVRNTQSGEVVSWRDGLLLERLSPDGAQAFVPRGDRWLALETGSWVPLGYTPRYHVHSYDEGLDLLYALENSRLVVLRPRWGEPLAPSAPRQAQMRGGVSKLRLSPRYDEEKTVFVVSENALYRSKSDGRDWVRLEGGLPHARPSSEGHLVLAMSPDYVRDHTLFAGGWDGDGQGFGVWRSFDSGDTWQPMWRGLTHLQVEEIVLSQDYASDDTLLAYCRYRDLRSQEAGGAIFRSSDRGEMWEVVAQATGDEELAPPAELLDEESADRELPAIKGGRVLTRGGDSEEPALLLGPAEFVVAQTKSSFHDQDAAVYVLSSLSLYRSTDGGETWVRARGELFADRDLEARFTDLDVSQGAQDGVVLALGDRMGQVYLVRAEEVVWRPVSSSQ